MERAAGFSGVGGARRASAAATRGGDYPDGRDPARRRHLQLRAAATFHGPVFNNAVFHEAVTLTHGLGAAPSQQAELAKALEALRAQLAALPAEKGAVANKAAESAKEVVAAAKPGGEESLFRGAVRSLRGWAEEIGKTVPAVGTAAEQVIKLAGQVRGWLPPDAG